MIEVTFTESAGGSLKCAKSIKNVIGSAVSVCVIGGDSAAPSEEEIRKAQAEAEERERRRQAEAIPMEGSPRDVYCFPLGLSMGDISVDPLSEQRQAFLQSMIAIDDSRFDHVAEEEFHLCRKTMPELLARAKDGEPVRLWYSDQPDEICGFCWLMTQLDDTMDIRAVKLPQYEEQENHTLVSHNGWGDVDPYQWHRYTVLETPVTPLVRRMLANRWKELCHENAPLRAVLNGKLVSSPEDLYDSFILRELDKAEEEFHEGRLIGNVLGRNQLGISDWLIHQRIQNWVDQGDLKALTTPEKGNPVYHRMLRKVRK